MRFILSFTGMQILLNENIYETDILDFLRKIGDSVHSIEELIIALRKENDSIEVFGKQNVDRLLEISTYQWQLEKVEMKLKAPSLIKIRFANEGEKPGQLLTEEDQIDALLLNLIMRFIRENGTVLPEK